MLCFFLLLAFPLVTAECPTKVCPSGSKIQATGYGCATWPPCPQPPKPDCRLVRCARPLCSNPKKSPDACCATCDKCSSDKDCISDAFCNAGTCTLYVSVGGACGGFTPIIRRCRPPMVCVYPTPTIPDMPGKCACPSKTCPNGKTTQTTGPNCSISPACPPDCTTVKCARPYCKHPIQLPNSCCPTCGRCKSNSDCVSEAYCAGTCRPYAQEGAVCGGIAAITCQPPLQCYVPPPIYPDKAGTCVNAQKCYLKDIRKCPDGTILTRDIKYGCEFPPCSEIVYKAGGALLTP